MKLSVDEIKDRVNIVEDERAGYVSLAQEWEALWRMDVWERSAKDAMLKDGQEQVTLPTTYNTVNLAMRLFSNEPKIEVPACHPDVDQDSSATLREKWLRAMWSTVDYQQRRSVLMDLVWQSLVRGRHCVEVKWVKDELPERMKKNRFPILIRPLDPLNVGIRHGPLYTEYAYHKYLQPVSQAVQRYPNLKRRDSYKLKQKNRGTDEEIEIIDFWYLGEDGAIWNGVIVDDEFVKKPVKTDYPDIPIIEGMGDGAPLPGETYRGLSILHPIKDLYRYHNRVVSQLATGVLYYFWPMLMVTNDSGMEPLDFKVRPGQVIPQPPGTKIDQLAPAPNVPLAQAILGQVDGAIQQALFPGVLYGQAPGELQAGYGVSLLSDAAKGRVNQARFNLERTLEAVNILALGLVETFAGEDGVMVWGRNSGSGDLYDVTLSEADINGYYENRVTITPSIPQDLAQKQTLALRFNEAGILSKRTIQDKYMDGPIPEDETIRVWVERMLEDEKLRPKVMLDMLREYYPNDWQRLVKGTPFEQLAMAEVEPPQPPGPPPGMMGPEGMPPMPPGMPPMPPGMMGPPPGPMPPPEMPPGMPVQAPSPNLDAGTIPPELAGQMTPELMGMGPGLDPIMFAQMMGQPLPPSEELNQLGGLA